jgi:large subunit ribosomal protein L14
MIQQQTKLNVSDNSGAKHVKCIKVLGGFKRKFAYLGNTIVVSIKELKKGVNSKVKKGDVHKALIIRTKTCKKKKDGSVFFFFENSVCLLNKQLKPIASRIIGPIPKELKKKKLLKLLNLSKGCI